MRREGWVQHGFLNTLDQILVRAGDVLVSLLLLWALSPDSFAKLAFAQATAAPLLFFFISPGWALFRHYAEWKGEGYGVLAARVHALRVMGWMIGLLAVVLAIAFGALLPASESMGALLWALGLHAGVHLSAADREFLRLELRLGMVNVTTLIQKGFLIAGTAWVAYSHAGNPWLLAAVVGVSAGVSAVVAYIGAVKILKAGGADEGSLRARRGPSVRETVAKVVKEFSLWHHLSTIVMNWVQTMDVAVLGLLGTSGFLLGLYSMGLKIVNLSLMLPNAMGAVFLIWAGRRSSPDGHREMHQLRRGTVWLTGLVVLQALLLAVLAPWIIGLFSHGRWNSDDTATTVLWMRWMLAGSSVFAASLLYNSWTLLRSSVRELFMLVYLPWGVSALALYGLSAKSWGPGGAAIANLPVAIVYIALLAAQVSRTKKRGSA